MSGTFVLAHLSDVHLAPMPALWPRHWNVKRFFGFVNWHRRRRFVHRLEALEKLTDDLRRQELDHIAVTGDLANIGLPVEHEAGLRWLEMLGDPEHVSVIPGNHDIYTPLRRDLGVRRWQAYMTSDGDLESDARSMTFPYVRKRGRFALIGMNSAFETPLGYATGRVDTKQLDRMKALLGTLGRQGAFRIVLIHHPPLVGQAASHRALTNAADVESALVDAGVELVLHGHNHRNMLAWRSTGEGHPFPVVGVPSASFAYTENSDMLARYNIYRISLEHQRSTIEMIGRGLRTVAGHVEELERRHLFPPREIQSRG
jgi:3',5'-cyclic AMP phosphodiesterase CpdA